MFAINVTGTFLCTQHALRPMVAARYGRIINFSTQLARASVGTGGFAAYAATKGAIEAFTRAMAHEFGPHGVTVNAIAPGGIDTDMSRAVMTPEYRARRIGEHKETLRALVGAGSVRRLPTLWSQVATLALLRDERKPNSNPCRCSTRMSSSLLNRNVLLGRLCGLQSALAT